MDIILYIFESLMNQGPAPYEYIENRIRLTKLQITVRIYQIHTKVQGPRSLISYNLVKINTIGEGHHISVSRHQQPPDTHRGAQGRIPLGGSQQWGDPDTICLIG